MCGIVGLFLKDRSLEPRLGAMLTDMLITMTDRGPDSAGIAVYNGGTEGRAKLTIQSDTPETAFEGLAEALGQRLGAGVGMTVKDTHAVLTVPSASAEAARTALREVAPDVRLMGRGASLASKLGRRRPSRDDDSANHRGSWSDRRSSVASK